MATTNGICAAQSKPTNRKKEKQKRKSDHAKLSDASNSMPAILLQTESVRDAEAHSNVLGRRQFLDADKQARTRTHNSTQLTTHKDQKQNLSAVLVFC